MDTNRSCCSLELDQYFDDLARSLDECIEIAGRAREQGYDPETVVEIPVATDLAERVENLVGPEGIAQQIRDASEGRNREETALFIAVEIVQTRPFANKELALDQAIRTGLAVLTEGVLVAPLEGVSEVKVKQNHDGTSYADVHFSGPIRAAGGTAQALSVLIADVVRRELKLAAYQPTDKEVERYKEEIRLYRRIQHLQYLPSNEEIDLIARGCPVCIDGDGTEDEEVSGNRDLERVETNRVRSGACLVMAEGMCLKAPKVQRHVQRLGVDGWEFIGDLLALMHKPTDDGDGLTDEELEAASEHDEKPEEVDDLEDLADGELDLELVRELERGQVVEVSANAKYMKELIAGRPVLAHPSRQGGFRLRYGRTRATGLAAIAMSPATMVALDRFVAIGTQLKIERPGKAGAITPCDTIEGPIALLKNGDLVEIDTVEEAKEYASAVRTFYDVGEVLIPFGEFLENNHALVPGSYSPEWWEEDVRAADPEGVDGRLDGQDMTFERALAISRELEVPLHPRYNLFWHDMEPGEIALLSELFEANGRMDDDHLVLPKDVVDEGTKDIICRLGALHRVRADVLQFGRHSCALLLCLGLEFDGNGGVKRRREVPADRFDNPLALVSYTAGVHVRARGPTRIGARMGRPEKAKERKMKPPPHVLFPVGAVGGSQRLVNEALKAGRIQVEMGHRRCPACGVRTPFSKCDCGAHTKPQDEPSKQNVDMSKVMRNARSRLGETSMPSVKGVKGMVSKLKVPETLEKGILRAKHGVFVFKDGTVRYDMTDVPITHFRPGEIGLPVERARELGYLVDVTGEPLEREDQVVELRPQDIVPSLDAGNYLVRTSRFLDDLLVKLYKLPAYYNAEQKEDLIGHLTIGLAPHTSGGVLCRIIGYTRALGCYAHPFFHASKRRNCDGDEDCIMLLLDGLINFSRRFLPDGRGGLMDAPLVLSSRIDPDEIDKEAQNLDVLTRYPLELYQAADKGLHPKELESMMDTVGGRIGTPEQYQGFSYTHEVADINSGVLMSAYKKLGKMIKKMDAQFELGAKIRAVDTRDEATKVIQTHFLPDMIGNLNAFSRQTIRCGKCNEKYRRMPLKGCCHNCGSNLTMTVHEASVVKYLDVTKKLVEKYGVDAYTRQRVEMAERDIRSLFSNDHQKQSSLDGFDEDC